MTSLQRQALGVQPKLKLTLSSNIQGSLQKINNWVASLYGKDDSIQEPSLVIQLYPKHFTLGNEKTAHSYNGPLQGFLDCVNQERIPAEFMDLFEQSDIKFYQGCLIVDVYDHRPSTLGHVTDPANTGKKHLEASADAYGATQVNSQPMHDSLLSQSTQVNSSQLSTVLPMEMSPEMSQFFDTTTPISPVKPVLEHKINKHEHPTGFKVTRTHLKPDDATIWASIELMSEKMLNSSRSMTQDDALELESILINRIHPEINLDPNPKVFHEACAANFDRCKNLVYSEDVNLRIYNRKRKQAEQEEVEPTIMDYMDTRNGTEFHPSFKQQSFRDDWMKKKRMAENDVLLSLDMPNYKQAKKTARANPAGTLYFNTLKLVRSIRFESRGQFANKTVHTLLNIYEKPGTIFDKSGGSDGKDRDQFMAVLRWGSARDRGDGGLEWYPIGNHIATEYYLTHFKGFYEIQHKTVSDTQDSAKTQKLLQQRQLQQQAQIIMAQQQLNQSKLQVGMDKMQRTPSMGNVAMPVRPPVPLARPPIPLKQEIPRVNRPSSASSLPGMETSSPPIVSTIEALQQQILAHKQQVRPTPTTALDIQQILKTLAGGNQAPNQNALLSGLLQPRTQPASQPAQNMNMFSMLQNNQNQKMQAQNQSAQIMNQLLRQQTMPTPPANTPPQSINPQSINPQSINPQSINPQSINPQSINPQSINPQSINPQSINPQSINPQSINAQSINPQSINAQSINPQVLGQQQSQAVALQNFMRNFTSQSQGTSLTQSTLSSQLTQQSQLAHNQLAQTQQAQQAQLVRLLQTQLLNAQQANPNLNVTPGVGQQISQQLLAALASQTAAAQSPQVQAVTSPAVAQSPPPISPLLADKRGRGRGKK